MLYVCCCFQVEIDLGKECRFHSVFACPILRQQSSDSNPPVRLVCGHVISRDALNKLTNSNKWAILPNPIFHKYKILLSTSPPLIASLLCLLLIRVSSLCLLSNRILHHLHNLMVLYYNRDIPLYVKSFHVPL